MSIFKDNQGDIENNANKIGYEKKRGLRNITSLSKLPQTKVASTDMLIEKYPVLKLDQNGEALKKLRQHLNKSKKRKFNPTPNLIMTRFKKQANQLSANLPETTDHRENNQSQENEENQPKNSLEAKKEDMTHQETYPSNEENAPRYSIQTNNKYAVLTDITNAMDIETANSEKFVTYLRNKNREKSHATKDKEQSTTTRRIEQENTQGSQEDATHPVERTQKKQDPAESVKKKKEKPPPPSIQHIVPKSKIRKS